MNNPPGPPEQSWPAVMNALEVAEVLRITEDRGSEHDARESVLRLARRGALKPIPHLRPFRFSRCAVLAFIESGSDTSSDAEPPP